METWFEVLGWTLSILTIVGNGFIIFQVICNRQLRTKTNALIMSLAVADFFVGSIVFPSFFLCDKIVSCEWPRTWPSLVNLIRWLFGYASLTNLCSLVLEHYIAIVKPLKYLTFVTSRRVAHIITVSWAIPFTFVIISFVLGFYLTQNSLTIFVTVIVMLFESFAPCMLIFCFVSIARVVFGMHRPAPSLGRHSRKLSLKQHRDKSAFIMMAIVVSFFLVCYGIYLRCSVISISINFHPTCDDFEYKIPVLILNSAINPWAYAFFKRDINRKIYRIVCKKR